MMNNEMGENVRIINVWTSVITGRDNLDSYVVYFIAKFPEFPANIQEK